MVGVHGRSKALTKVCNNRKKWEKSSICKGDKVVVWPIEE